jgi:hypothetical protein
MRRCLHPEAFSYYFVQTYELLTILLPPKILNSSNNIKYHYCLTVSKALNLNKTPKTLHNHE